MAATVSSATLVPSDKPPDINNVDIEHDRSTNERKESFQGPHDWRKRLKPVRSPIKAESFEDLQNGDGHDDRQPKSKPLPPWKRDLVERNKKVARLVRRESSGRSKRSSVNLVRRESSGKSKKGCESPSGVMRRRSFKNAIEDPFVQQVVNESSGRVRSRISPANSFKNASGVRRTPSDKVLDPNDPSTKKRVERVRRARLYLLQQMGPNSFLIVGDSPEHKFKVIIGPQTCNCGKTSHCVHVLFVMLRVFQVSENDACLWSRQLKNYEVENLFRAYNAKRTLRIEAKRVRKTVKASQDRSRAPSPGESIAPSESDAGSVREEDDICPICLLEMVEGESLLQCHACQNKLHHHCITVWFDECKRQKDPRICPLCRTRWKQSQAEVKTEEPVPGELLVPPNTRVPSPQHEREVARLPYAEPIPGEFISMTTPWIEILGEDLVACFFSRNWSIRETGLKHLGKEISRDLFRLTGESRSGMSMTNTDAMVKMLECCFSVVAFMCQDPVYKVFVGCLKVLRSVLSVTPSRDHQQKTRLQALLKPVIEAVIVKCTDGNRRTSQLSISTMVELARGQQGELALGRDIPYPGTHGLGGMAFLVGILTEKCRVSEWQWLLGRLYVMEKFVMEFSTEFLPRQRPDGASSESSLELMGAASSDSDEEMPQNYDRLFIVAEFAVRAVSSNHARISRVAKRVFLLTVRYAAQFENLVTEMDSLLRNLDFGNQKSLRRQIVKIVSDYHLPERVGRHLPGRIDNDSLSDSPSETPVSSPKCTSPVTMVTEVLRDMPEVPPNTPIRERHNKPSSQKSHFRRSFDFVEDEGIDILTRGSMKSSKSLDDLEASAKPRVKKISLPSPNYSTAHERKRSRSKTPQRIGPVLETNLDEVIQMEEQTKRLSLTFNEYPLQNNVDEDVDDDLSLSLQSPTKPPCEPHNSGSRLLSHDIETDIDSVESDLETFLKDKIKMSDVESTEIVKQRNKDKLISVPKSLSLDLDGDFSHKRNARRSISPCAHGKELERKVNKEHFNHSSSSSPQASSHIKFSHAGSSKSLKNYNFNTSVSDHGLPKNVMNSSCQSSFESARRLSRSSLHQSTSSQRSQLTTELQDLMAMTPVACNEKPVTFESEVAMGTPKHSPSHTLDKDDDDYHCKEEVEKEEALALAKAMEVSCQDPPKPIVPGLTPLDQEEVITIRIQPDDCNQVKRNGEQPVLYFENVHWVKGPLLGTGAFSTCYQARDVKTGTIMALKQISFCRNSKTEQENVIKSITEEIQMMAKLSHPHIVRIMGATRQGCHFNMFVEWMPGGSVSYILGQYGRFSEEVIMLYVLQILRGLAYLHENQILHRDLKGANLLIDSTGQRLRIGDFGAAARLASKGTGAGEFQGQLLGTIAFMAPEVLRGETYGRACDVWSVGCCMIEMATTKPPWNANDVSNHLALIFKIANAQSTPPVPDKLSPPLRDLLLRCLEPVKEQRPTAKDLLIHPLFTQYMQGKT